MQIELRHRPSYGNALITLEPQEEMIAESGAMIRMAAQTQTKTRLRAGLFWSWVLKFLGGESLFVNVFTGGGQSTHVVIAPSLPGDVVSIPLQGTVLNVEPGALLAMTPNVTTGVRFAGFGMLFAREGMFKLQLSGQGTAFLGGFGSIEEREINGTLIVDSDHVIAFEPTLTQKLSLAGGLFSSFFSGEGLVSRFEGRGKIWLQTRNVSSLAEWANSQMG